MIYEILWTATITPFKDEEIDYDVLEALLWRQAKAGNGILLLGSTGEALLLKEQEKRDFVTFACSLNLSTPLMVGLPSHNKHEALSFMSFCNDLPLQGYLMTTPMYTKAGIQGQTQWFETLLDKAQHPAMLYNIPGRSGVALYPETVMNLKDHENFCALKDSGGVLEHFIEYRSAIPHKLLYCGDDNMMPLFALHGANGLVSVASNVWPYEIREYVQHCMAQEETDSIWPSIFKVLFAASNPIPVKALMKDAGLVRCDSVRSPLSQRDFTLRSLLLSYYETLNERTSYAT